MCCLHCSTDMCSKCKNFKPNISYYGRFYNLIDRYFIETFPEPLKLKGCYRISGLAKQSALDALRTKKDIGGSVRTLIQSEADLQLAYEMYKTFLNVYAHYTQD